MNSALRAEPGNANSGGYELQGRSDITAVQEMRWRR